jgi:hypothetical protein
MDPAYTFVPIVPDSAEGGPEVKNSIRKMSQGNFQERHNAFSKKRKLEHLAAHPEQDQKSTTSANGVARRIFAAPPLQPSQPQASGPGLKFGGVGPSKQQPAAVSYVKPTPIPMSMRGAIPIEPVLLEQITDWLLCEHLGAFKQQLLRQLRAIAEEVGIRLAVQSKDGKISSSSSSSAASSSTSAPLSFGDVGSVGVVSPVQNVSAAVSAPASSSVLADHHILFCVDVNMQALLQHREELCTVLLEDYAATKVKIEKVLSLMFNTSFFAVELGSLEGHWQYLKQHGKVRLQLRFSNWFMPPTLPLANLVGEGMLHLSFVVAEVCQKHPVQALSGNTAELNQIQVFSPCEHAAQVLLGVPFESLATTSPTHSQHADFAHRRIAMLLTDELCDQFLVGDRVRCIGQLTVALPSAYQHLNSELKWGKNKRTEVELWMVANNVLLYDSAEQDTVIDISEEREYRAPSPPIGLASSDGLPSSSGYVKPFRGVDILDWNLTEAFVESFGSDLVPPGEYLKLRLVALLSLLSTGSQQMDLTSCIEDDTASTATDNTALVSYLSDKICNHVTELVSSDGVIASRFLGYALSLHPRSKVLSTHHLKKFEEAASLERDGLVLFLQPSIAQSIAFHTALRQSQNENVSGATAWFHVDKSGDPGKHDPDSVPLAMDLVVDITEKHDPERDAAIANFVLASADNSPVKMPEPVSTQTPGSAMERACAVFQDDAKLATFLHAAQQISVSIGQAEHDLIKRYFLTVRCPPHNYPKSALDSVVRIACAHSRVHLRDTLATVDVMVAINLYEESIAAVRGTSALQYQPLANDKLNLYDLSVHGALKNAFLKHSHNHQQTLTNSMQHSVTQRLRFKKNFVQTVLEFIED